ncbi:MAG: right-handed parallel beta-helix repeat-containing protein, partial [Kiritimatiellae bacterium]|nr:right-handed parallel beta-helix repeat-containing protein [Kiritimatiellia bacterium]
MTLKNASLVNGTPKNYAGGGFCGGTIESCVVSNCMSTSRYTCYGAVYNATVVNSLIVNNVNTNSTSGGRAAGVSNCKVYNSTIANNVSTGYPGGANYSHLKNCIVYGNTARSGYSEYNEVRSCQNEALSTGVSVDIAAQSNLIGVDPWFVDAANGDWRLTAGSPAIDVGEEVTTYEMPFYDLSGEPSRRIKNNIIDYGCYEGGVVTGAPVAPVATGTSAKAGKGLPFVWAAVPNAAEYRIYRGTSDDVASATLVGTTTATNYLDTTTTGGTDYYYWISAYANSEFGESAKCGPIAVTSYADLKIETASLPAATEAVPYSVQLECSGNVGAATWSLPYTVVTREASTFDGSVGEVVGDDWPERDTSYQHNPIISLPFTFTWFGTAYDKVRASSTGGLYFGAGNGNSTSWSSYSMGSVPKIAVNEGPYTSYYYVQTSELRVESAADHVTIVWKGTCDGKTMEFSATLDSDNTVRLAYGTNKAGAYVAFCNVAGDPTTTVQPRLQQDCSGMDDIVITCLPNESSLALSEDGLLSGIEDFAGSYKVSALVTDADNGDTVYKTFTLTVNANANTRPVIDSTSPATGGSSAPEDIARVVIPAGDSQAFSVAARDPEGAALNYSWFLDDNLVSSGSSWTFATTDADLGRHTLVCEVADALWTNGQVYAEWDISVGQKLYVNAVTGTTNGTGTAESPFKTLQQAEEWLSMGATVLVAPGTYAPVRLWGWTDASVVFRATGSAAETIIDGGGSNVCVDDWNCTKEFTFIGFTLRNGGDTGVTGGATGTASYGVNLRDCVITGCTGGRCTIYGADVEDCTIYGNTATRYGAAVGFCNVVNSLIYGNTAGGTGVVYRSTLDHCTVYGNTAMVGGGLDATSTADHSIVWGKTATSDASTANYQPGTNDVQFTASCTTPLPAGGEGNIAQNPQFVDAAGGDFHLADGSPCKEFDM